MKAFFSKEKKFNSSRKYFYEQKRQLTGTCLVIEICPVSVVYTSKIMDSNYYSVLTTGITFLNLFWFLESSLEKHYLTRPKTETKD